MARFKIKGFDLYQYDDEKKAVWSKISNKFLQWSGIYERVTLFSYRGDQYPANLNRKDVLALVDWKEKVTPTSPWPFPKKQATLPLSKPARSFIVMFDGDIADDKVELNDFVVFDSLEKAKRAAEEEAEEFNVGKVFVLEILATATKGKLSWKDGLDQ